MDVFKNVTNDQFKRQAVEFFRMTEAKQSVSFGQAVNGNKVLSLLWLNRNNDWTDQEIIESMVILNLAQKREMEIAFTN